MANDGCAAVNCSFETVICVASYLNVRQAPASAPGRATIPSHGRSKGRAIMADVHRVAFEGFSNSAPAYARGRPEYPDELLVWLHRDIGLGPKTTVIDLGAGFWCI